MTWNYLKERAAVALSGIILALLVIILALLIASRTLEYRSGSEAEQDELPEVTIPDVVWVTELPQAIESPDITENP